MFKMLRYLAQHINYRTYIYSKLMHTFLSWKISKTEHALKSECNSTTIKHFTNFKLLKIGVHIRFGDSLGPNEYGILSNLAAQQL